MKNIDSISNKDGQKIEFKDGGTTISGGNVSVDGNNITHVKAGKDDTDAVNVKQLKDGIAQATTKVAAGKNVTVNLRKMQMVVQPILLQLKMMLTLLQ